MQTANNADRSLRTGETGHQWEEVLSGTTGTFTVRPMQTFRVRATGATTVTIDSVLAMTMASGEIAVFCAGRGKNGNNTDVPTAAQNYDIPVVIAVAGAYVQVARDKDYTAPAMPPQFSPA